jgi:hypothetical protein
MRRNVLLIPSGKDLIFLMVFWMKRPRLPVWFNVFVACKLFPVRERVGFCFIQQKLRFVVNHVPNIGYYFKKQNVFRK